MRREYAFRYMEMLIQYTAGKGNITENDHTQPLNKNIWNLFPLLTSNLLLFCKKNNLQTPRQFAFIDISSTKQIYPETWKLFLIASNELNKIITILHQ